MSGLFLVPKTPTESLNYHRNSTVAEFIQDQKEAQQRNKEYRIWMHERMLHATLALEMETTGVEL